MAESGLVAHETTRVVLGAFFYVYNRLGHGFVEVKAVDQLARAHEAQLINYLRAAELPVGLLLNFGPRASYRRLVGPAANRRGPPRVIVVAST